jgi:uncharacterized protein (TIGR00369 family)
MTTSDAAHPPAGFVPVKLGSTFASHSARLFARWHVDRLQLGFRVEPHQVNPGDNCHGGMLSLFADILLSSAAQYQTDIPRQFLPTISLQLDFINGAPLGTWVQGEASILQVTKNLVFSQGLIMCNDKTVARASGVFRRGPLLPDSESDYRLELPGMPQRA